MDRRSAGGGNYANIYEFSTPWERHCENFYIKGYLNEIIEEETYRGGERRGGERMGEGSAIDQVGVYHVSSI